MIYGNLLTTLAILVRSLTFELHDCSFEFSWSPGADVSSVRIPGEYFHRCRFSVQMVTVDELPATSPTESTFHVDLTGGDGLEKQ